MHRTKGDAEFRLGYRPALDGLRGVAVLAVMIFHAAPPYLRGGWIGVDIFFTLSGYLITSLLLDEHRQQGRISLPAFYARRALRLLPALFLLLATYLVLTFNLRVAAVVLLYSANWTLALGWPIDLGALQHTWSLSIEEQFYLLWPLCLIGLLRLRLAPRTLARVIFTGALLLAGYSALVFLCTGSQGRVYHGLDTRADALMIGCALASWLAAGSDFRRLTHLAHYGVRLALGLLLGLMVSTSYSAEFMYLGGLLAVAVAVACLIFYVTLYPGTVITEALEIRPLVWIGRVSYGLYLWHFLIFDMVKLPAARFSVLVTVHFALTFAIAALSYYVIERPALKLKTRFNAAASVQRRAEKRPAIVTS